MFNLPDLSKLEQSIDKNTLAQRALYEQILILNEQLQKVADSLQPPPKSL